MKIGLLTALWVVLIVGAFWKFEGSYLIPVRKASGIMQPTPAMKLTKKLDLASYQGKIVLINFWNPDCACSEFAEAHVRQLDKEYSNKGVEFVTVVVTDAASAMQAFEKAHKRQVPGTLILDSQGEICKEFDVLAAPAAVIYGRDGQPVYRGAYNIARFCDSRDTAFAQKALQNLVAGKREVIKPLPFYGCTTVAAR